jgi:uncharacterized cupin superfamily protein
MKARPACVRNVRELPSQRDSYPGDAEPLSEGTPLSRPLGLSRLGIHHELLPPGSRTSWPHAEEREEEFVYVLEGNPELWLDGELFPLAPGDAIGFPPGTGHAHTFVNNGGAPVRLLVVGERLAGNRIYYPLNPGGFEGLDPARRWLPEPPPRLGPHDGLPDALRAKRVREE